MRNVRILTLLSWQELAWVIYTYGEDPLLVLQTKMQISCEILESHMTLRGKIADSPNDSHLLLPHYRFYKDNS